MDEYQDTSVAQFQLVSLLTGPAQNICVVGDDDQSIYRFRGATIENILNFERYYPGAKVIRLEQNYRSTSNSARARPSGPKTARARPSTSTRPRTTGRRPPTSPRSSASTCGPGAACPTTPSFTG